jgi:hypothetical protein
MRQQYPEFIQNKLNEIKQKGGVTTVSDEEHTYVLIALGERKTGGYDVKILGAEEKQDPSGSYIVVKAKETRPAPGDMVIQVITYPTAVYKIPKTTLPVKVEWVRS